MTENGAAELGIALVIYIERSQEETIAPDGDAALAAVGEGTTPDDILIERDAPLDRRGFPVCAPCAVGTSGLRPMGEENAARRQRAKEISIFHFSNISPISPST